MPRTRRASTAAIAFASMMLLGALVSCTATARITDTYMALDGAGDRRRKDFLTDTSEIHCVVEMGIGRKGSTVSVFIRQLQRYDFASDRFIDVDNGAAQAEAVPSPQEGIQKLDVRFTPVGPRGEEVSGAPFPPGRFQCEASLDGELQKVAIFNVDFPLCPMVQIRPGTQCFGFYKNKKECPRYGLTSAEKFTCTCSIANGWECQS